jgi:hypothetical protein
VCERGCVEMTTRVCEAGEDRNAGRSVVLLGDFTSWQGAVSQGRIRCIDIHIISLLFTQDIRVVMRTSPCTITLLTVFYDDDVQRKSTRNERSCKTISASPPSLPRDLSGISLVAGYAQFVRHEPCPLFESRTAFGVAPESKRMIFASSEASNCAILETSWCNCQTNFGVFDLELMS